MDTFKIRIIEEKENERYIIKNSFAELSAIIRTTNLLENTQISVDFELNGESLMELIRINRGSEVMEYIVSHLGYTLFFNQLGYEAEKLTMIRLLGRAITENDLLEICQKKRNKKVCLETLQEWAAELNDEYTYITICRDCGDLECGCWMSFVIKIAVDDQFVYWNLKPLYGNENLKIGKYFYQFDRKLYVEEINRFDRFYQELL